MTKLSWMFSKAQPRQHMDYAQPHREDAIFGSCLKHHRPDDLVTLTAKLLLSTMETPLSSGKHAISSHSSGASFHVEGPDGPVPTHATGRCDSAP